MSPTAKASRQSYQLNQTQDLQFRATGVPERWIIQPTNHPEGSSGTTKQVGEKAGSKK
jgi:hypothetical protein